MVNEKIYTIPLRKEFRKAPSYKHTSAALKALRRYIIKHMKVEDVKIGFHLNKKFWERGRKNPYPKIKVKAIKEDNLAKVELPEFSFEDTWKKEVEKKEKKPTKKEETKKELEEKIEEKLVEEGKIKEKEVKIPPPPKETTKLEQTEGVQQKLKKEKAFSQRAQDKKIIHTAKKKAEK